MKLAPTVGAPAADSIDAELDAIKTKTDNLPSDPADQSVILAAIPSAVTNATAVRAELSTELARIDATVSTRLASSAYTAPDNANIAAVAAKLPSNNAKIAGEGTTAKNLDDITVDTSTLAKTSELNAAVVSIKGASDKDLTQVFNNTPSIDPSSVWAYATRTLTESAGLTPAQDANLTAIKAKTDNLPANPAAVSDVPTAVQTASAVRTELATELARIDIPSSTLATTVQLAAIETSIKGADDKDLTQVFNNTPSIDPTSVWSHPTRTLTSGVPTAEQNASAVRTELSTELARIDVAISTRTGTPQSMPPVLGVVGADAIVSEDPTAIIMSDNLDATITLTEL
jgi:hypothetical protein